MARTHALLLAAALAAALTSGCPVRDDPETTADAGGHPVTEADGQALDALTFAIVGDTRPAELDDTAHYPTAVISQIWGKIEAHRPAFAIATGDYVYASTDKGEAAKQLDLYLAAQEHFKGTVWHVFGNHECAGWTNSNCGEGTSAGVTPNYAAYMEKFQAPQGLAAPYYTVRYAAPDGSWTARLVVIAANAWTSAQEAWLDKEMTEKTATYTFILRHMDSTVTKGPGVVPSDRILSGKGFTILIAGHAHTFTHQQSRREIVVGNGGAPLSGDYFGYVIAARRADGAIEFSSYDYASDKVVERFAVNADGSPAN